MAECRVGVKKEKADEIAAPKRGESIRKDGRKLHDRVYLDKFLSNEKSIQKWDSNQSEKILIKNNQKRIFLHYY